MTTITLDLQKSLEENANAYFEAAKKARKKSKGVQEAIKMTQQKVADAARAEQEEKVRAEKKAKPKRKLLWYEKFRWFISSDDILCIGGRDATTNEMVVKKHADKNDWLFHTDMAGSPFVVVKVEEADLTRETVPDSTMEEAAQYTACMSRAWKNGLSALEVFYVQPDQVTKEAQAGESLPRGAFMIRGKTTYKHSQLRLAACKLKDGRVMVGPPASCQKHATGKVIPLVQGNAKSSDVAKQLQRLLEAEDATLDEIIRALPPGGVKIGK